MIKAFLSHSSVNKEFVRAVAKQLGRQFCHYDEQVFDTAEAFKVSIEKHLDATSVFVLFATSDSIKRIWVDFEISEAWYRSLQGQITRAVVVLIDSSIQPEQLPPWLNRAKVMRSNSPATVAREIRHHLDEIIRQQQHVYFEGRNTEMEEIQRVLTPIGEAPPRVVGVYGLPNIGRRTFIRKAVQLTLSFNRTIPISIAEGDSVEDIAIKVASAVEPYSTEAGFKHIIDSIQSQPLGAQLERIIGDLRIAISNKEMPVFIDDGGILNSDGGFEDSIRALLAAINAEKDLYIFLVSTRKPPDEFPLLALRPLAQEHIKRLISKISATAALPLNSSQISELAEYVNGYPPSAYYAVDLVKTYGIDLVLADKNRLVQFRSSVFIRYLKSKTLTELQKNVLLVLARYSPIPLQVIVDALKIERATLATSIMSLVDHSLIVPDASGLYSIAEPISEAVVGEFRTDDDVDHAAIYESIKSLLATPELELPRLDLHRLSFRAAIRSGASSDTVFRMTNDLIELTEDFYHRRDYTKCIGIARLAIAEAPNSNTAWDYLIRALIQDEQWELAENEIDKYEKRGTQRDIDFLRGFLERKRGRHEKALQYFLAAERHGRTGVALKREIANCYFLLDDLPSAKNYVTEALASRDKENRYVLDLAVQIACREGDEKAARTWLEKLSSFDSESFTKHRLSTVELRFGDPKKALEAAREATSLERRPTFGMLVQLATCCTRNGDTAGAEQAVNRIKKIYGNQREDIRLGLECRLEIERKQYERALHLLMRMANKNVSVYKAMRRDAIVGQLLTAALTDQQRIDYEKELSALNAELSTFDPTDAWLKIV